MQYTFGKRAACPPTPPTAQPPDTNQTALGSLTQPPPIAAPPDQPATAVPQLRPGDPTVSSMSAA
jgi:hypothetical protein